MVGRTNSLFVPFGLTVTDYSGTYDGAAHGITASVPAMYASATTIQYRTTTYGSWSSTAPTRTNAGTTTVYVRAVNSNFTTQTATATITINPAPVTLTANSGTRVYNRYSQSVTGFTSSVSGLTFSGVSASGSGTNVGTYTVTIRNVTVNTTTDSTGNYIVTAAVNGTLTITKAPAADLGLSVTSYSGYSDGNPHGVSVSVSISSGTTIYYRTSTTGSWTTTAPTRTSNGTTTVYVKAENSNYETATATGTITLTTRPTTGTISFTITHAATMEFAIDNFTEHTTIWTRSYSAGTYTITNLTPRSDYYLFSDYAGTYVNNISVTAGNTTNVSGVMW